MGGTTCMTWPKKWAGMRWTGEASHRLWILTEAELKAAYEALRVRDRYSKFFTALGLRGPEATMSHTKAGRATQLLRKAGLIEFSKAEGWVVLAHRSCFCLPERTAAAPAAHSTRRVSRMPFAGE